MKEVLLAAAGAVVLVDVLQIHLMKRRPFNCTCCMAGWFCLGLSIPAHPWYHIPFLMAGAMIVSCFTAFLLKKTL